MAKLEDILKITDNYDIITFDVFDTLLIRDVMKPTDVFRFSYGEVGRYIRIIAEIFARKASKTGEVTIHDIDRKCPFSCKKEVQFEKRICRANPLVKTLYEKLKKQGKKMYAISDMYLDSDLISKLLKKAGYDIPVIVSCEQGCTKASGKLFQGFLGNYSYKSSQVLHIGDNRISDYEGAHKAGINSLLIRKHSNQLSYTRYNRKNYELAAFVNHGLYEVNDPIEKLGYEIIGPIILSFCQWIHKKYKEVGFERLYFLARDMRFTYEIYRKLYPNDDARYLCVSRKSLLFARENPDAFCEYLKAENCYGNVSIVDTGWIGNAQVEIEKYAKMIDPSSDIGGLYFGSKLAYRLKKRSDRSYVCMYSTRLGQFKCQLFPAFMETLIGSNEKQVIRYESGRAVFDREEDRDYTNHLKDGARRFISGWVSRKDNKCLKSHMTRKPFERLFYFPLKKHIKLIGNLHYEDFKDTSIVSFDDNFPYWRKPRKLLSDLSDSGWKGGFLKHFGVVFPIVLFVYFIFGSFRLLFNDIIKTWRE